MKNDSIKLSSGWVQVVLMLLLPLLGLFVHSWIRFDRLEQGLGHIEREHHMMMLMMRKHWGELPDDGDQHAENR